MSYITRIRNQILFIVMLTVTTVVLAKGPSPQQVERDEIFGLATLALIYKDWQSKPETRGHNIGSILVNKDSHPVFWARNSVKTTDNATQHGEVRLIQAYLNCKGVGKYMDGYTIYTTLEPCAMCTGMIAMTKVDRVVYVQADPEFGHALKGLKSVNFPRVFVQDSTPKLAQKLALEKGWVNYRTAHKDSAITDYLLSDNAKTIYASAMIDLNDFKVKFSENQQVLNQTLQFLNKQVGLETFGEKMLERCPAL